MMRIFLFTLIVGLSSNLYSAEAGKKTRTLKELTALAMEKGEDDKLGENIANSLGFEKKPLPIKELYFYQEITPDGFEHVYHVTYNGSKPKELIWTVSKITTSGETKSVDGYMYLVSLDGKLKKAIRPHGTVGDVVHDTVPLDTATKERFKKEVAFWTKDSIGLEWSK